jgi:hypothetical protein
MPKRSFDSQLEECGDQSAEVMTEDLSKNLIDLSSGRDEARDVIEIWRQDFNAASPMLCLEIKRARSPSGGSLRSTFAFIRGINRSLRSVE